MVQSPKPVHAQPYCILCAVQDLRHEWGSFGFPPWRIVKGEKYDFGGRVYACEKHVVALEAKAIAEGSYRGPARYAKIRGES